MLIQQKDAVSMLIQQKDAGQSQLGGGRTEGEIYQEISFADGGEGLGLEIIMN